MEANKKLEISSSLSSILNDSSKTFQTKHHGKTRIQTKIKLPTRKFDNSSDTDLIKRDDEGTFLTSVKASKEPTDEQKAIVLFGKNRKSKPSYKGLTSSNSSIENIQLRNLKKPPIYLPELRNRKDIWKGKSSSDLLAQNTSRKGKKKFDPTAHLRGNKNWFLVPNKNVLL